MNNADGAVVRGSVAWEAWIDQICDQFEDACRAGRPPGIADFLGSIGVDPASADADLLRELARVYAAYAVAEAHPDQSTTRSFAVGALNSGPSLAALAPDRSVQIPGYEILDVLGQGGMGIVYRARQVALNRIVAIKMIRFAQHSSASDSARFKAEAEAIARLQHLNVVQVYEIGTHEGLPYFSMEFCGGGTLKNQLAGTPLPQRKAARLIRTLALAVHALHQKEIVHRDLKPANVLLGADGSPKIADFGLVKYVGGAGETVTGAILGTPNYMAPEQASGQSKDAGPPCDIYALGAILYELLVGRPPFAGASVTETLDQVRHCDPVPPGRIRTGLDGDLETICLTCLAKRPEDRYATAKDLAEDLDRFLVHEPVKARPMSLARQFSKALGKVGLVREFRASGWFYLLTGAVFAAAHTAVFFELLFEAPEWAVWPLFVMPSLVLFSVFRRQRLIAERPLGWADKQIWPIWGGQALGSATILLASRLMNPSAETAFRTAYPALAVLTGLAFLVMGRDYWGRHYLHGLMWMAGAVLMALTPTWAPLEAAALTAFCLGQIGVFLLRFGRLDLEEADSLG
jgi:tRNA A-37 threonylcarbamoyl transferase component Bud32